MRTSFRKFFESHKKLKVPTRLPISSGRKFEVPPARRTYASERAKDVEKYFFNFRHFSSLKALQTRLRRELSRTVAAMPHYLLQSLVHSFYGKINFAKQTKKLATELSSLYSLDLHKKIAKIVKNINKHATFTQKNNSRYEKKHF
ncbi:MAG: hypothetical protein SCARUB_01389 [Candidatus Scalindua rubra]|uniref:Uncharacterized protein n=1 Tax=Candidatus Scalindua rubra TaxID=1872076 RepID=A0A1E3XCW8_9BACT|nr:MAG: hypothetical protein SCARUB_01389 [Candidatus Scalindua rubra]